MEGLTERKKEREEQEGKEEHLTQKLKQQQHKKHPEGLKQTYNKTASQSGAHAGVFVFLLHSVKPFLLRGQEPPANPPRAPSNAH